MKFGRVRRFSLLLCIAFSVGAILAAKGENPGWDCRLRHVTIPYGCYFDTGISPKGSPKVMMKFKTGGTGRIVIDLFGTRNREDGCFILNTDDTSYYYRYGKASHDGGTANYCNPGVVYDLVADSSGLTVGGKVIFTLKNKGTIGVSSNLTIPGIEYPSCHSDQANSTLTLYSFKMEDDNGVCDLIPCKKDGRVCLYDVARKRFIDFTRLSQATSDVVAGPVCPDDGGPGWDCRLDSVTVLSGDYFSTGYIPRYAPKVTMRYKLSGMQYTDIFGTAVRQDGCFILNNSNGVLWHRYGKGGSTQLPGSFQADVPYDIVVDASVVVNGKTIGKADKGDFSKANQPMDVPGRAYPGNADAYKTAVETIYSFTLADNDVVYRNLIPCLKDGQACFFDTVTEEFIFKSYYPGYESQQVIPGKIVADDGSPVPQRWFWRGETGAKWTDAANWTNRFGFVKTDGGPALGDVAIVDGPMTIACGADEIDLVGLEVTGEVALSGVRTVIGRDLTLDDAAQLVFEDGATLGFDAVKVGETPVADGFYATAAWISGATVRVGRVPWSQFPWDYRVQNLAIPNGGRFDTGFVPRLAPRAELRFSIANASKTTDLFGTPDRENGCFILNMDKGPLYYRYGTSGNDGAKSYVTENVVHDVVCDDELRLDGACLSTYGVADFSKNRKEVSMPGKGYLGEMTVYGCAFFDGGMKVRDYVPCVKDGAVGLFDLCAARFLAMTGEGAPVAGPAVADDGGTETWFWCGASGAAWNESANWTNANGRVCTVPNGPSAVSDVVLSEGARVSLVGLSAEARNVTVEGEGTVAFAGAGSLKVASLALGAGVTLELGEGTVVGACVVAADGETLARGIYRAGAISWLNGAGELRTAGKAGGVVPEIVPVPSADGWYEFGDENGSYGCSTGYSPSPSSTLHWIVAEWPVWEKYAFPPEAKLRLKGYVILDTVPAGFFGEVDTSSAKYIELHQPQAFADGTKLVVPENCFLRYQPGTWKLDGGKYWLLSSGADLPVTSDLDVSGTVAIYGDNTRLSQQTFDGAFTGRNVRFYVTNFSNQGRFRGTMDFTGYTPSLQCGNALWFDTLEFNGHLTSAGLSGNMGQFATNGAYSACGFLFGRDDSDETADHELTIDTLTGWSSDIRDPAGRRWRCGNEIIVWGGNTVHIGKLENGLHVVANRTDQDCWNGFWGSAKCKGVGNVVIDNFASGTLYLSTNVNAQVGAVAAGTAFDYTFQSKTINRMVLDVMGACDASAKVKATDLAMLPARLSGFGGQVELTETAEKSYPVAIDVSKGTDAVYNDGGCAGSGELASAPAAGTINLTIRGGSSLRKGKYGIARFTSGGELLAGWSVNVVSAEGLVANGDGTFLGPDGFVAELRRDASGIWLKVYQPALRVILR